MNEKDPDQKAPLPATSRRTFLRNTALAAAGLQIVPAYVLGATRGQAAPSDRLNIAGVGVGGMGRSNLKNCAETENIVALCDVDPNYAAKTYASYPKAKVYVDYREMLEKQKDIDAVIVATPDHTHAVIAMAAMRAGKHVYVQKPLTHSVARGARAHRGRAQVQGGDADGQPGPLGRRHPHGLRVDWGGRNRRGPRGARLDQPAGLAAGHRGGPPDGHARPCPTALDWDLWIGPAPMRPYHPTYHPRQLARVVGFRHRLARRPGLPHPRPGLLGAEAEVPDQRRGQHLDLLARLLEEDGAEERDVSALDASCATSSPRARGCRRSR